MTTTRLTSLCAAIVSVAPAIANAETSAVTDAFVAATARSVAVLQRSDDVAAAGGAHRLRAFAERDRALLAETKAALASWAQGERRAAWAAAHTPSIDGLGPLLYPFDSTVLPLGVRAAREAERDRTSLAALQGASGAAFAALYASICSQALGRLEAADVDYIKNGDDPVLRRFAVRALPTVRSLLAEVRRL